MTKQILFIEDDDHIRSLLVLSLQRDGFSVIEASSGEEGLAVFARAQPEMVIVDLRLPGMNGFAVTRELRRISDVPIAIVTASGDSHDVVAGLEAGADDYVVKPVVAKELAARVRALLRRARQDPSTHQVRFGDVLVHKEAGTVHKGGAELSLTKTEFRVLCELAEHPGWVVSRGQLLERVWGYDFFGDERLVEFHVSRLRAKLEDDPTHPRYIATVRGIGYKLVTDP